MTLTVINHVGRARMAQAKRKPGRPPNKPQPADNTIEIDDLIGDPTEAEEAPDDVNGKGVPSTDLSRALGGVSANWLAQVFGYDKNTIRKKLTAAGCPVHRRDAKATYYLISEAAKYLVKPKIDLDQYLRTLKPNDLPPVLSETYWAAMLKRQKWEENAGHLWRTEDVHQVFGDFAITVKTAVTLWVEEVDRHNGITADQRATIRQLSDNLLETIYEIMVEAPNKAMTLPSSIEAISDEGKEASA